MARTGNIQHTQFRDYLTEIFEAPYDWEWEEKNSIEGKARFVNKKGETLGVRLITMPIDFNYMDDEILLDIQNNVPNASPNTHIFTSIEFGTEDEYGNMNHLPTKSRDASRVFATLINIILEYVEDDSLFSPKINIGIGFIGANSNLDRFYKTMLMFLKRKHGNKYSFVVHNDTYWVIRKLNR